MTLTSGFWRVVIFAVRLAAGSRLSHSLNNHNQTEANLLRLPSQTLLSDSREAVFVSMRIDEL